VGLCGDEAGRAARRARVAARLRQRLQVQQRGLGRAARLQRPARCVDGHAVLLIHAACGAAALTGAVHWRPPPEPLNAGAPALSAGDAGECGRRGRCGARGQAPVLPPRGACAAEARSATAAGRAGPRSAAAAGAPGASVKPRVPAGPCFCRRVQGARPSSRSKLVRPPASQ
jgi:hypothetical protein